MFRKFIHVRKLNSKVEAKEVFFYKFYGRVKFSLKAAQRVLEETVYF